MYRYGSQKKINKTKKHRPSPYIIFCMIIRPQFKQKYPNATFGEMGRLLMDAYRMLSDEQLKIFVDIHNNYDTYKTFEENTHHILNLFSPPQPEI